MKWIFMDFMWCLKNNGKFKKNEIKHTPFPQDLQIGSNQYETYETYENYMKNFKVIEITKTEAENNQ